DGRGGGVGLKHGWRKCRRGELARVLGESALDVQGRLIGVCALNELDADCRCRLARVRGDGLNAADASDGILDWRRNLLLNILSGSLWVRHVHDDDGITDR